MTEAEWLGCNDPQKVLEFLQPDEEARKTRLFKCACCRLLWHLLTDKRSREGVVVAERIADGEADQGELSQAVERSRAVSESKKFWQSGGPHDPRYALHTAAETARDTTANKGFIALGIARWTANALGAEEEASAKARPYSERGKAAFDAAHRKAFVVLCDYIRDIFGVLMFRAVGIDPHWLSWGDGTVVKIAQGIYDDRAFDRMPILADALEDAGCHDAGILGHLRSPGPHVRGCWALDLILADYR